MTIIEQGMNLLFDLPDLEMGYPAFHVRPHPAVQAEKIITVADSYFWGMYNFGMSRDALGDARFGFTTKRCIPRLRLSRRRQIRWIYGQKLKPAAGYFHLHRREFVPFCIRLYRPSRCSLRH